jgi:hypothetical protein
VNGVSKREGRAPGTTGIVGHLRRRREAAILMIGGRNLGGPCDTGAQVEVSIDRRRVAQWTASAQSPFLQVIPLAAGDLSGVGEFATLEVTARDAAGTARVVDVAIEHFDLQSPGATLAGFGRGWHMPELDAATGLGWRWTDEIAEVRVESFGSDMELVVRGESPLRYFRTAPTVVAKAGGLSLGTIHPTSDFEWVIPVPASALADAYGIVTIESTHSFVPDEVEGNGDRRRLALRIFSIEGRLRR